MEPGGTHVIDDWKTINIFPEWVDVYDVSRNGVVKVVGPESKPRKNIGEGGELPVHDNGFGYKMVQLRLNGKMKNMYIHRLVATMFLPNPEKKPCVGHKDHDRSNNTVDNLYWCTHAENTQHGVRDGKINAKKRGTTQKLSFADVCQAAILANRGMGVAQIAKELSFPRTTISSLFNGRSNAELFQFALEELK